MNIAVDDMLEQDVMSRYDLAKLLNAVECQDCITAPDRMITDYSKPYWENFIQLPGKDFDEILYREALYNEQSYYYCVAYVGDQEYMRGYPESVSPVCAGMFCGAKSVTKAEFLQVVINLLSEYIFPQYSANWSDIAIWTARIADGSQEAGYVDITDTELIQQKLLDCPEDSCKLESAQELKTYLKYCMFNLEACDMQAI